MRRDMEKQFAKKQALGSEKPELTLRDLLTPFFRHRKVAITIFAVVFAATTPLGLGLG